MAVTSHAFFVTHRLGKGLAQGDAHIFHQMVAVDMQIAHGLNVQIHQTVAGNLVQHVVEEADARRQLGFTRAVEVELDSDAGLGRVAADFGGAVGHGCPWVSAARRAASNCAF